MHTLKCWLVTEQLIRLHVTSVVCLWNAIKFQNYHLFFSRKFILYFNLVWDSSFIILWTHNIVWHVCDCGMEQSMHIYVYICGMTWPECWGRNKELDVIIIGLKIILFYFYIGTCMFVCVPSNAYNMRMAMMLNWALKYFRWCIMCICWKFFF